MSLVDELVDVIEYETSNRAMAERIAKAVVDLLASKAGDVRGMLAPVGQGGELEDMHIEWDVLHYVLDLCAERIAPIVGALRAQQPAEPDEPIADMIKEPTVIINGVLLTNAQAMTLRVALTGFWSEVSDPEYSKALGPIGPKYEKAASEIWRIMVPQGDT